METILLKPDYVLEDLKSYKIPYRLSMMLTNRSKINICTDCFTKLEYQLDRDVRTAFLQGKKTCIFAPTLGSQHQ